MTLERRQRPFVREAGAGAAVVCIHSSASSSAQWRPLMDHLACRFRVLAADLYGSGRSPAWPAGRPLSLDDEVRFLEPVFASAGDRIHLIGHSYGGAVALRASLVHPERIESLVLVEPVLFSLLVAEDPDQPAAREIAAVRDATTAYLECGDPTRSAEHFVDYWSGPGAWAAIPEERRFLIAKAMTKIRAEWQALFTEPTPLAAFAALEAEATLIVGSESPASSKGVARLLARTLPRLTVIGLPGVGHMAPVTHPRTVNAVIASHLERALGARRSPGDDHPAGGALHASFAVASSKGEDSRR